jgi:hypothetical protein
MLQGITLTIPWSNDQLVDAIADWLGNRGCPMPDDNPNQISVMIVLGVHYHRSCYRNGWIPSVEQVAEKVASEHLSALQEQAKWKVEHQRGVEQEQVKWKPNILKPKGVTIATATKIVQKLYMDNGKKNPFW